ncbi:sporulation YhaL family protein [Alkalihalobacillus sp. CinArs1]|uniref:sporulation YhaL family protein n=1 Tax=Alkalihalobacillus sp. CinArs1 TaxID=2995314 RepID=UPI0022DE45CE|nr:sporulation YhaL family protein [Alkalihalobacillus sp. CinArs1]
MRKGILVILGVLFIISILQLTEIFSAVTAFASGLPWWVYFVLAGIIYSGYKSMTLTVEDRKVDQIHIEEEGKVYVKRMEDERERRKKARVSGQ